MYKYIINPDEKKSVISKNIYGHFSEHLGRCIYGGLYVGKNSPIANVNGMRTDVVEALKKIHIPVLRWPGGCFADEYHWRDGIGPMESRKKMINTHWGGVVEDNSFGTHEFLELCRQLGCDAYISGNAGSGSVQEMSEWVEYITFDGMSPMSELRRLNGKDGAWELKFFGIGNESWGCGGNMYPEYYADVFRRYNTYVRNYYLEKPIYRIACGANGEDYNWTDVLMKKAGNQMNGLSLHYYTVTGDWEHKGSAASFSDDEYMTTIGKAYHIDEIITRHSGIMDRYDYKKRVGLIIDEWGTWHDVEEGTNPGFLLQQNTMRDAIVAAYSLNIFNKHSDRVKMANIAQIANVLQSVILTEADEMLLTPTYHVFDMYKEHMGNTLLGSFVTTDTLGSEKYPFPNISESASINGNGIITATLSNASLTEEAPVVCRVPSMQVGKVSAVILSGRANAHNTFEHKEAVCVQEFTDIAKNPEGFTAKLPPCSVVNVTLQ